MDMHLAFKLALNKLVVNNFTRGDN